MRCHEQPLMLCQVAENRHSTHWHCKSSPNKVVLIGTVAELEQEARRLFETIRNPEVQMDLSAAWTTLQDYAMAKRIATSIGIND